MAMSAAEIELVVETLRADLATFETGDEAMPWGPSVRVREAHDDGATALSLTLRAPGQNLVLTSGTSSRHLRVYVATERVRSGEAPQPFTAQLRRRLVGGVMTGLSMPDPNDRIVMFQFAVRPPEADDEVTETLRLWVELTGRNANLVLTDASDIVVGAQRPRLARTGRARDVPAPPPAPTKGARQRFDVPDTAEEWASLALGEAIERHYARTIGESERRRRVQALRQSAKRALKRGRRRLDAVESDLNRANAARRDREIGDLLSANYHCLERGMASVEVEDLYVGGTVLEVELDPAASPRENVDRYYARHRKYESARTRIEARLRATEDEVLELELALETMREWSVSATEPDDDALSGMTGVLRQLGVSPASKRGTGRSGRRKRAMAARERAALPYRRFESSTGREILVGKNARGNDALTFRVARGSDMWLHASGDAGSHVIVRLTRGDSIDETTLAEAAMLAAHYSKASRGTWAEVRYTLQKHVRKVRGGPPGLVTLAGAKTIEVELDAAALSRLKAFGEGA